MTTTRAERNSQVMQWYLEGLLYRTARSKDKLVSIVIGDWEIREKAHKFPTTKTFAKIALVIAARGNLDWRESVFSGPIVNPFEKKSGRS